MRDATVYLCGGINGLTDEQCTDWRELAKKLLRCPTLDPMRRDYRGVEGDNVCSIVNGDRLDLRASTHALVNATKPSWGTGMEVRMASAELGLFVVCFVGKGTSVSPWLRYHSNAIVDTVEQGCELINKELKEW